MNKQELRRAISDISGQLRENHEVVVHAKTEMATTEAIEQPECECCGIKEECTSKYVSQVMGTHLGKWVCGLCSEAVKERLVKAPELAMQEAVGSHRRFCQEFNNTRLNPKLSLTCSMRDLVRKSFGQKMVWKNDDMSLRMCSSSSSSMGMKLARTSSCVPRANG